MRFKLVYRGQLSPNGRSKEKQDIRRHFHTQLAHLWKQKPLKSFIDCLGDPLIMPYSLKSIIKNAGAFSFAPLVCEKLRTIADLDIIFLRPEEPGAIITKGGDIDNRIKTLLDALRMPKEQEIPKGDKPRESEQPFFTVLEDDALITHLSVTTDRLLEFKNSTEVLLLITVNIRVTETLDTNIGLA